MARIMAAMATGISSASQGCMASEPDEANGGDDQPADGRDPPQVAGDLRLVAVDVVADQGEQGGHDGTRTAAGPAGPARRGSASRTAASCSMPEQDELLLADRLVLLDEDVALACRCRTCPGPGSGPASRARW